MNNLILLSGFLVILLGLSLLVFILKKRNSFGVLLGKRIYQDTKEKPGELLIAKSVPLRGKPDYLIKENGMIFPVEVKTGKTPAVPYLNHQMQLMAYCLLVEENFQKRPFGGYIRYPKKEFKIGYTDEAKESVKNLILEIMDKKKNGEELFCKHPEHAI